MGRNARSYGAALDTRLTLQERTMTAFPPIVQRVADIWRKVLRPKTADDRHRKDRKDGLGAHDLLLVVSVAAVVLGVVMVSQGVLPAQLAAHVAPSTRAWSGLTERLVRAQDERPVATKPSADRVPPTPAPRTAISGAITDAAACPPRLDLDHDLRLVLAAMALQRRRTLHATANFVPPDKQDVPASVRALATASVAHAEEPPPAYRRPNGSGC
jgi:hypothetical protein